MKNPRLVIITNGNYYAQLILKDLFGNHLFEVVGVLIVTGDYKARTGFNSLYSVGKQTGLPYLIFKIFTIFAFKIAQILFPDATFSVGKLAEVFGFNVYHAISVNSIDAIEWASKLEPDMIISVSCPQLIRENMLTISKCRGINIHSSLLPIYAGLAPYYWVLSNGEKVTGITIHYLTKKFDEGNILVQKRLEIPPGISAHCLFEELARIGSKALVDAIQLSLEEFEGTRQDLSQYSYFSNPDFSSYLSLLKNGHCLIRIPELISSIKTEIELSKNRIKHSR